MADEKLRSDPAETRGSGRPIVKWLIGAAILAAVFLLGLVPMWLSRNAVSTELEATKLELRREQIANRLASAAIYARRGEYESARQNASQFFTDVQGELDKGESKVLTEPQRSQLPQLLTGRDDLITLLSRGDPASAEKISDLYIHYRGAGTSMPAQ